MLFKRRHAVAYAIEPSAGGDVLISYMTSNGKPRQQRVQLAELAAESETDAKLLGSLYQVACRKAAKKVTIAKLELTTAEMRLARLRKEAEQAKRGKP